MAGTNNNSSVVVVGRTAPVPPGQQTSQNSVPVVIASDQTAVPVEEQNKQQSEVALSLLGIPRSEVALGIFADVNTYDVNPTEWTAEPEQFRTLDDGTQSGGSQNELYGGYAGDQDWGLTHIPEEAGAMIEAPSDEYSILTSKRFFRYQPGRVSAATFGVKLNRAPYTIDPASGSANSAVRNPAIKKYGIFDKFDGYYFESRNDGYGDNFACVRRTQSLVRDNPIYFGPLSDEQLQDYAWAGVPLVDTGAAVYPDAYELIKANKRYLQEVGAQALSGSPADEKEKCRRDVGLVLEGILHDLKYGGNASTVYNADRFYNKKNGDLYLADESVEIARYNAIKAAIADLLSETPLSAIAVSDIPGITTVEAYPISSIASISSVESGANAKIDSLIDILLDLFIGGAATVPDPVGSAAGHMCVLRDGLIMIHAAAHDPSLLKEKVNYTIDALLLVGGNRYMEVTVPEGKELLQKGQNVSFCKNGNNDANLIATNADTIDDGSIWYVNTIIKQEAVGGVIKQWLDLSSTPTNEEIYTTQGVASNPTNPWNSDAPAYTIQPFELAEGNDGAASVGDAVGALGFSLKTPTAFLLPDEDRKYFGTNYTDGSLNDNAQGFVDGAFPYAYPPGAASDPNAVGYVDSATGNVADLKGQINYVNRRLYKNWINFNVDPQYYKVYEYRVPRSRFSGEKLNGEETPIVYSDNVLDKTAGQPVEDPTTSDQLTFESVWDLDPTKVTMYKIEFSWYGAVGATFLAYVPIENNEARWVRVHHLRASNQLKVASLGNATLPITYLVYGGGSENRYGYENDSRLPQTASGYGSYSEQLIKYGASYYIDGGDRGTVRLFSYASESLKGIAGSNHVILESGINYTAAEAFPALGSDFVKAPYLEITDTNNSPAISDYYMNATVKTNDPADQNVKIVWVDSVTNRLYLNKVLNASGGNIELIADRPQPLVGLRCRREINGVRNRVQIYPTRLATGATSTTGESLTIQLIKTPIFQTYDDPADPALPIAVNTSTGINIGSRGKRTLLPSGDLLNAPDYLTNGTSCYGYFRYLLEGDFSGVAQTMLGLLERDEDGEYYFSASEVTLSEVVISGEFLRAGRWGGPSTSGEDLNTAPEFPKETLARLSAVETDSEQRSPIPGTGTVITTLFAPPEGEEFNLQPYFDYNKEYLSFPLTDLVDSLYVAASSKAFYLANGDSGAVIDRSEILASLTWEEQ